MNYNRHYSRLNLANFICKSSTYGPNSTTAACLNFISFTNNLMPVSTQLRTQHHVSMRDSSIASSLFSDHSPTSCHDSPTDHTLKSHCNQPTVEFLQGKRLIQEQQEHTFDFPSTCVLDSARFKKSVEAEARTASHCASIHLL